MVPIAEALQQVLQTQVIRVEWLWLTPPLCGPCGEDLHMTLQIKMAAVGCSMETPPTPCCCCSCCSVAKSCLIFCDPMDCNAPGFPVLHYLLEFAQTYVYGVGDAIQPSHSLSLPFPALNLSQHQGLFQWISSSLQVVILLELQFQHQSFQWIFRVDFL